MGRPTVINYTLRPAKNIERKMLAEGFARLAPLAPLPSYRYIGFGSFSFNDFSLYHHALGIRHMVNIERDVDNRGRYEFNRPFKCITMRFGESGELLPLLDWDRRTIVWLDNVDPLNEGILMDIGTVISRAVSGSVVVFTVNAHPFEVNGDNVERVHELRLAQIKANVGGRWVAEEVQPKELKGWGTADLYWRIMSDKIEETLQERNAPEVRRDHLHFRQLFHFRYADGAKMLTVGGVIASPKDWRRLGTAAFGGLSFLRTGKDPFLIAPPTLTGREVSYLNQRLPKRGRGLGHPRWLSETDRHRYVDVYRYFPIFAESEL